MATYTTLAEVEKDYRLARAATGAPLSAIVKIYRDNIRYKYEGLWAQKIIHRMKGRKPKFKSRLHRFRRYI